MPIYRLFGYDAPEPSKDLPFDDAIVFEVTGYNYNTAIYRSSNPSGYSYSRSNIHQLKWFRLSRGQLIELRPAQFSHKMASMEYTYVFRLDDKPQNIKLLLETPDDVMPNIREARTGHMMWVKAVPSFHGKYIWEVKW